MAKYNLNKTLESHITSLLFVWRGNGYAGPLKKNELYKVGDSLLKLQRGLTGNRNLAGKDNGSYMQDSALSGAYLLYYWPVSFMQVQTEIQSFYGELKQLIQSSIDAQKKSLRILDLGSGSGSATAAFVDAIQRELGNKGVLPLDLTLVDYSSKALGYAKKLLERDFTNVTVKTICADFEKNGIKNLSEEDGTFDIIVTNHCLNELWKTHNDAVIKRSNFIKDACSKLNSNGILLLSEPALLLTSRNLIKLRDVLLKDCGNENETLKLKLLAPCNSASKICPCIQQGENITCHGDVLWNPVEPVASLAKAAGLDRNSYKMTYFAFKKVESLEETEIAETKKDELSGVVVSEGMLNKAGRVRFVVCNGTERLTVSAKQNDAFATKNGFFNLRRYDNVSFKSLEIRGDKNNVSYGISPETQIKRW